MCGNLCNIGGSIRPSVKQSMDKWWQLSMGGTNLESGEELS